MRHDPTPVSDSASTARDGPPAAADQTRAPGGAPGASANHARVSQGEDGDGEPFSAARQSAIFSSAEAGKQIGPYRILQAIGEGGMGTIFKAEQRHPIRRVVALKLVKLGMDTKAVIARFEAERQALSMMDHPNIAKALDAGATDAGRPYFVMEYVAGLPITAYCNKKSLPTRDRLELFAQVCDAVQHAHHKGVIHRDLKPGNVLVAEHDGKPQPKVIDFGVAKATHGRLTDATLATEVGGVLGTLGYMSPEQAELSGLDVDSRTDVYSLGVLLYELLVGEPPFDPETLRKAAFTEAQRIIREEDPPRPSTKLTTKLTPTGARLASSEREVARKLGSDLEKRVQELRGELDWIPLKALRKDRDERYATPSDLAQDVRRYLAGEPIEAHPPSTAYRVRKLLRRHRGPVAAAAVVLLTLILGIVGTTWFAVEARREAARATEAEGEALLRQEEAERERLEAERQRREALRQQAIAEETNGFLIWMFERADPTSTGGKELTAAELIAGAVEHLEERLKEQPLVKVSLQHTLGLALFNLGRPADAEPLLRRAMEDRRNLLGPDDPKTISTMRALALVLGAQHKPEAETLLREIWKTQERKLGPDHPDTIMAMGEVGVSLMMIGQFAEAEPVLREMSARARRTLPPDHRHRVGSRLNLGIALQSLGRSQEAEKELREGLDEMERTLGTDAVTTLNCRSYLARVLMDQRRYDEAAPLAESALTALHNRNGPGHWFTKEAAGTMIRLYEETSRPDEALALRNTYNLPAAGAKPSSE